MVTLNRYVHWNRKRFKTKLDFYSDVEELFLFHHDTRYTLVFLAWRIHAKRIPAVRPSQRRHRSTSFCFRPSLLPLLPLCPLNQPQAWPANGSQSKIKLLWGQLLVSSSLSVIFLCLGGIFSLWEALSWEERSVALERGREEKRAAGEPALIWSPAGLHGGGALFCSRVWDFTSRGHFFFLFFSGIARLGKVKASGWRLTQRGLSHSSWMRRNWRGSRGRSSRSCRPQGATLALLGHSFSSPWKIHSARPASTLWSGSILYSMQTSYTLILV